MMTTFGLAFALCAFVVVVVPLVDIRFGFASSIVVDFGQSLGGEGGVFGLLVCMLSAGIVAAQQRRGFHAAVRTVLSEA